MIARQEWRLGLPWSLPSKTCSGISSSTWAGHLTEKPLAVQLQVPYNRKMPVMSVIASPCCRSLSPPHLIGSSLPSVLNTFFLHHLHLFLHLNIFEGVTIWFSPRECEASSKNSQVSKNPFSLSSLTWQRQVCKKFCSSLPVDACWAWESTQAGNPRAARHLNYRGWRHK